ncbi:MAG: hypothetical protein GY737_20795 [Desulfobacteraceae bacterium]|nr:hypothetical protein [Desulfobacteraceae bacterium]
MKLITILSEFIKKARQESAREYSLPSSEGEGNRSKGWIGVDLDGTLARSDTLFTLNRIGDPVPKMLDRVKSMIERGTRVKIFTARASDPEQIPLIEAWLRENEIPNLEVTNIKDYDMIRLYDDRAVQVIANTGEIVTDDRNNG